MKFSHLQLGKRAERTVKIPFIMGDDGQSQDVEVVVVPADGIESGDIAAFALEYAKSKGAIEPKDGDPLYDLGAIIRTLALCVLDAESTDSPRAKFFDGGNKDAETLPRETMVYLFERQQLWQDECSPSCKTISPEEFLGATIAMAKAEDDAFFTGLRPGIRWIYMRTSARLLWPLLEDRSPPGSLAEQIPSVLKQQPEPASKPS